MPPNNFDDWRRDLRDDFQFRLNLERRVDAIEARVKVLEQAKPHEETESPSMNTKVKAAAAVAKIDGRTKIWIAVIVAFQMIAIAALALFK